MENNLYYRIIRTWIEDHYDKFQLIDAILFLLFSIVVIYLLLFVIAALMRKENKYPQAPKKHRILVFIPVYKDNMAIFDSLQSIWDQDYPDDKYLVVAIARKCSERFITELKEVDADVVAIQKEGMLLSEEYRIAMKQCVAKKQSSDIVFILSSGNIVEDTMFNRLNDAYYSGCSALQTHRMAKERKSSATILDAVSEEINNTIFRKGHTALGFSSALIGSGMAFDFELFQEILPEVKDSRLEKQFETALLKRNIYIEYLESAHTYEDKAADNSAYYKTRRSWITNQRENLFRSIFSLPKYLIKGRLDYCNKIFQWLLPSRILYCLLVGLIMIFMFFINWTLSIKWFALLVLIFIISTLAVPNYLVDKSLTRSVLFAPFIFFMTFVGILRSFFSKKQ